MLGRSVVFQVTERMRQQRQPTASQLPNLCIMSSSSAFQNAVSILLPSGTVKCLVAVLRLDAAKASGSELHRSGYLAGFRMTSPLQPVCEDRPKAVLLYRCRRKYRADGRERKAGESPRLETGRRH